MLCLLFLVIALGAPLWGAPLMVLITVAYLLGWTRWRDARRAASAPQERPALQPLFPPMDSARLPVDLRDRAFLAATRERRQRQRDLVNRTEQIEERIAVLGARLLLLALSELDRIAIRAEIEQAQVELARTRQAADDSIFSLAFEGALLVVRRSTRAECDCPDGHWGCHAIVDSSDGHVVRECAVCTVRWIETTQTSTGQGHE